MDLIVSRGPDGAWRATFGDRDWACAIGAGGVTGDKREGDGATPLGCFVLRFTASRRRPPSKIGASKLVPRRQATFPGLSKSDNESEAPPMLPVSPSVGSRAARA